MSSLSYDKIRACEWFEQAYVSTIYCLSNISFDWHTFKSLSKKSKVFMKFDTGIPASAACERLFSDGKDVFSAKRTGCLITTAHVSCQ